MKRHRLLSALLSAVFAAALLPALPVVTEASLQDSGMDYTESTETISNPGMGYTSTLWYTCKPGNTPVKDPSGSLVLMFIDIGAFSCGVNGTTDEEGNYTEGTDYDLDSAFFEGLRGTLANCRKNGSTVALRFRYDSNGKTYPEPASFDQVLHHIDQIREDGVLEEYKDILMFVESGFVGAWGEQHSGKYTSLEYKAQLLDAVLAMTPDDIPVTVRTPNIFATWAGISMAELADWVSEPGSEAARVGLYNDGYMGSDSDLGTYSNRAVETAWLGRQGSYYGGEFSGNLSWAQKYDTYLPEHAIPEMYLTHLSYINGNIYQLYQDYTYNAAYDVGDADHSAYYGQTVFKFIRDHLGYRFTVRDCDLSESCTQGGRFDMAFSVENTGFANPIRPQKAQLILEKDGNYVVTDADIDSRDWASCTTAKERLSVKVPGSLTAGDWNVYLRLSVGDQDIADGNQRTVKFANNGIYSSVLGANRMGTIRITEARSTDQRFQVNGKGGTAVLYTFNDMVVADGVRSMDSEWTSRTLLAEKDSNKLYVTNDEEYLYVAAEIHQDAASPVYNLRVENADDGKSYWFYRQRNGATYYSQGSPTGIRLLHDGDFVEFCIPFGEVMDLHGGTLLGKIRVFVQDEADTWKNVGDLTGENYTITPQFGMYAACQEVLLRQGADYTMRALSAAAQADVTWLHDGSAVGTGEYLTLSGVTEADSGSYAVHIVSAAGTAVEQELCQVTVLPVADAGDVNADGSIDATDAVLLQQYLLHAGVSIPGNADLNADGNWDILDLALLKQKLRS